MVGGFDNLTYIEAEYDKLPEIISSFDVAILPIFGGHKKTVPVELFQYLACGKNVVASEIENLPECEAIFASKSTSEVIDNISLILSGDLEGRRTERVQRRLHWNMTGRKLPKDMTEDKYNYSFAE